MPANLEKLSSVHRTGKVSFHSNPKERQCQGVFKLPHSWHSFHMLARTSLVAQAVKRLPTMWETRVQSLGWEDPLEKEMATHSSTPAWRIPWMEEPAGL